MDTRQANYTILIADDDHNVHQSLSAYFRREGYAILCAFDGGEALKMARSYHPDMILLDIMMPDMDGIEVCRAIRAESNVPIIMLTARSEEFDKLLGLETGADDYITKPFSPREVLARVKTVLRRMGEIREKKGDTQLSVGNLFIDMDAFQVRLDGEIVPCTPKEIEILWTLASNPAMVFSRERLLESVWGYDFLGDTRAVDSHIKRIRAKLCKSGNTWDIRTVWGVGYRFEMVN